MHNYNNNDIDFPIDSGKSACNDDTLDAPYSDDETCECDTASNSNCDIVNNNSDDNYYFIDKYNDYSSRVQIEIEQ